MSILSDTEVSSNGDGEPEVVREPRKKRGRPRKSTSDLGSQSAPASPPTTSTEEPNPFDPERLRLPPNYEAVIGVKKHLLTVPVRRPDKSWWVQTHPDESYRLTTAVIELKEDRETYLVDPSLLSDLSTEATLGSRMLFTAITRQGTVFIWPVKLPQPDGRQNAWNQSDLDAAQMAAGKWCRVVSNMHLGAYQVLEAASELVAPQWPDVSFKEILEIAFRRQYINSPDHAVLQKLRGET